MQRHVDMLWLLRKTYLGQRGIGLHSRHVMTSDCMFCAQRYVSPNTRDRL